MKKTKAYENFPIWIVLIYIFISISLYFVGFYLLYLIWSWLILPYLIYILYIEFKIYKEGCIGCYYYGKMCGGGRGKLAKLLFKKGSPNIWRNKKVSFKDFIPSLFISIIPIAAGIFLLIKDFNWLILVFAAWPIIIWFFGNPLIYGELICPNCKQAQICCPVCEYFMKKAMKKQK